MQLVTSDRNVDLRELDLSLHLVRVEAFFMGLKKILDILSECLSRQSYCFWLEHSTVNLKVEELRLGHYSELLATRPNAASNQIALLILL